MRIKGFTLEQHLEGKKVLKKFKKEKAEYKNKSKKGGGAR